MNEYMESQLLRAEIEADPAAYVRQCHEFTLAALEGSDEVHMPIAAIQMLGTPVMVAESAPERLRALAVALEAAYRLGGE